ncbi:amino acid ABC transporter substrate-binding protein [Sinomonas sp. G460-2]|uniref:amino acid ABC transporter substrate-binding protein n=1 Tax=Sinomonas sp. G460-2 TaxID=3393464 RepID=UPI0039F11F3F
MGTPVQSFSIRRAVSAGASAALLMLSTACGAITAAGGNGSPAAADSGDLKIGASLPLTGTFAEFGQAAKKGYETWASVVNAHGGLLNRHVQLIIRDDASDQNTAVADYHSLLSSDKVDLLLGTFSSPLVGPTSAIAETSHKLFVTPTGGDPKLFQRGFKNLFMTQQATAIGIADVFVNYILSLPPSQRPKTAAYPTLDDSFQIPTMDQMRSRLEAAGIKTVYQGTYSEDTQNFDQIATQIKDSGAELVAQGASFDDGVGLNRSLVKAGASPKYFYQTAGADSGSAYSQAVGSANTNGIFFSTTWSAYSKTPGNTDFMDAYRGLYGADLPHEDAADAYVAGQVLQAAVTAVGAPGLSDQSKLADWLRTNQVTTIIGDLAWNGDGSPKGEELLGQWQNNAIQIVRPEIAATTTTILQNWR